MKQFSKVLILSVVASNAFGAEFIATGKIQKIFALDKVQWGADSNHILISGFSAAGTCAGNDGLIALVLRDDDSGKWQASVALAAKMADKPVVIRVDDTVRTSRGNCYLKYLELN